MDREKRKGLMELIGFAAIVVSLIFVGMELRQNTIASRAAAYQELGIATTGFWHQLANNRELNDLFMQVLYGDSDDYAVLDRSDKQLLISLIVGSLRAYETVYLQVQLGLLDESALESLGWENFRRSSFLEVMWPDLRPFVSESFAEYVEGTAGSSH